MHEVLVQNLGLQLADAQRGQTPVFDNNIVSEEAWEVTASALIDHFYGPDHAAWRAEQREKVGLPTTKVKLRNGDTICTKGITSTRCETHRKTNNRLRDADEVDFPGGGQDTGGEESGSDDEGGSNRIVVAGRKTTGEEIDGNERGSDAIDLTSEGLSGEKGTKINKQREPKRLRRNVVSPWMRYGSRSQNPRNIGPPGMTAIEPRDKACNKVRHGITVREC